MNELFLIDAIFNVKSVFGSVKILDELDEWDTIQICKFAKIVNNYMIMNNKLNETN